MIKIEKLVAGYNKTPILKDFDLNLEDKKIYVLIGPSGCGKSTLLKVLCGILKPQAGKIIYKGEDWYKTQASISYAPQNYGLLPWKKIKENICLPLEIQKQKTNTDSKKYEILDELIKVLNIGDILDSYPREISGGQKQRASLARAFSTKPDLLLMDEPFSALDALTGEKSQDLFLKLNKLWQCTTLFITHNIDEALKVGQKILIMKNKSSNIFMELDNPYFGESFETSELINSEEYLELVKLKLFIKKQLGN